MAKEVTMFGFTYEVIPAEEADKKGLNACALCSFSPKNKHGASLRTEKKYACLDHSKYTENCMNGHFFKLIKKGN